MRKEVVVEPLVGHLRHPYSLKDCVPDGKQVRFLLQLDGLVRAAKPVHHLW